MGTKWANEKHEIGVDSFHFVSRARIIFDGKTFWWISSKVAWSLSTSILSPRNDQRSTQLFWNER